MNGYWIAAAVLSILAIWLGFAVGPDVMRYIRITRM
jgi:hypothetical protein